MRIIFVYVGSDLKAMGFRRMAAIAKEIHPPTEVYYILPENFFYVALNAKQKEKMLSDTNVKIIAGALAKADLVCFSSFSQYADLVKDLLVATKKANPDVFLLWGGVHPIVDPENAIRYADAICVGEGELAFQEFLTKLKSGDDYRSVKNFHFRINGKIVKNGFLPLITSEQMEDMPMPVYAENERIFKNNNGFVPLGYKDYLKYNNLSYDVIWAIGCPFSCSYCSNSTFIKNDKYYRKLRHPSANRIINEIKSAIEKHPFISTVGIHDDSFMALPYEIIREFSELWKREIALPFAVPGLIPNYVKRDKLEALVSAGMIRTRMGIQSGSERILKFYNRPNNRAQIQQAASIIAEFSDYLIPTAYDIIVDNPIETRQDIIDTLELSYWLPRPLILNLYSLRVIPNTELADSFAKLNISYQSISESYGLLEPTLPNFLFYLLAITKPPRWFFDIMLKKVGAYGENRRHPVINFIVLRVYLFKRVIDHLRFHDFYVLPGRIGYWFWKIGIIGLWNKRLLKKYRMPSETALPKSKP